MKVSLGMITKDLLTKVPLDQFIDNAKKFNREIYSIVIAYAEKIDLKILEELREEVDVHVVKIEGSTRLHDQLSELGVSSESIKSLIGDVNKQSSNRAGYGRCRNHVALEAMLTGSDVLLFIDTDVFPELIIRDVDKLEDPRLDIRPSGIEGVSIQEVDFIGRHLEYLIDEDVAITTSDYTGYYIIPPMKFDGMEELFHGLKKEKAYHYISNSYSHKCLSTDNGTHRKEFNTYKVLGGNVAIKLKLFEEMVPFFSTTYKVEGNEHLTRGEDTVLALQMRTEKEGMFCDIDTKIFHNTYGNFPEVPDIENDKVIKDRFYNACMGWIGRNPFLNYLNGENIDEVYEMEHRNLVVGTKALVEYLNDDRFLILPKAHDISYGNLEIVIEEFEMFKKSWFEFIEKYKGGKK